MPTPDGYLNLSEAAKSIPGRPHRNNVYRWCIEGTLVRGERVMLRSARVGSRIFTKQEWIDAFLEKTNSASIAPSPSRRPRRRTRAEQAEHDAQVQRELQELGLA